MLQNKILNQSNVHKIKQINREFYIKKKKWKREQE